MRASRAFDAGLKLVQLREKDWPADRVAAFAARLRDLAHAHGAKVLLNGAADAARRLGTRRRALDVRAPRRGDVAAA